MKLRAESWFQLGTNKLSNLSNKVCLSSVIHLPSRLKSATMSSDFLHWDLLRTKDLVGIDSILGSVFEATGGIKLETPLAMFVSVYQGFQQMPPELM